MSAAAIIAHALCDLHTSDCTCRRRHPHTGACVHQWKIAEQILTWPAERRRAIADAIAGDTDALWVWDFSEEPRLGDEAAKMLRWIETTAARGAP